MEYFELFEKLRDRTRMFISERSYSCVTSFLVGYGCAKQDVFEGFREWLTYKYNAPNNFVFSGQIEYVFKRDNTREVLLKEDHLINFLFKLFFEFDLDRKNKGLEYILNRHKEYMRKQLEE